MGKNANERFKVFNQKANHLKKKVTKQQKVDINGKDARKGIKKKKRLKNKNHFKNYV